MATGDEVPQLGYHARFKYREARMTHYQPRCVLKIGAELGEHPIWSVEGDCLYWLDIENSTINRFIPTSGKNSFWKLPSRPGCFALQTTGNAIIAAQDGFYDMNFATGAVELIMRPAHDPAVMRFNDGHTDNQGRLWISTVRVDMNLSDTAENSYYRLDGRDLKKVLRSVGIPNGTAFSPDGKTMYRAESTSRQIFGYDYDTASGTPSNERVFAKVPDEKGMPDGATVDDQGGYWVAVAAPPAGPPTGGVARFTPDGKLDRYIDMPVPFVTMVAFGGPKLSTLYITTARLELFMPNGVPEGAGDLFAMETDFRGIADFKFRRV
jgi:sugar lactone lactonase YvrE